MNFNEQFIPLALRTESTIAPLTINRAAFSAVVDACVIVGNLADFIKKKAAYNKPIKVDEWNTLVARLETILPFLANVTEESFAGIPGDAPSDLNTRLFHGIFGLFTESTELMEALQKAELTGEWDIPNLKEELGDQAWYQAILVDELMGDMDKIQEVVIAKLCKRYPEKYSDQAAIERDLVAERKILEQ